MRALLILPALALGLATAAPARAEDAEDRLRAALKQSVGEMRAAQDAAASAQAQLATKEAELASTKQQLDAANAKLAEAQGKGGNAKQLEAQIAAASAENAALRQSLQQFQGRVSEAQDFARARARETALAQRGLAGNTKALETCKAANARLIDASTKVLHLWEDKSFLWVLRKSYEPVVGAARVDLENIVQTYEEKLRAEEYVPPPGLGAKP